MESIITSPQNMQKKMIKWDILTEQKSIPLCVKMIE